jgi:hypothetical protein
VRRDAGSTPAAAVAALQQLRLELRTHAWPAPDTSSRALEGLLAACLQGALHAAAALAGGERGAHEPWPSASVVGAALHAELVWIFHCEQGSKDEAERGCSSVDGGSGGGGSDGGAATPLRPPPPFPAVLALQSLVAALCGTRADVARVAVPLTAGFVEGGAFVQVVWGVPLPLAEPLDPHAAAAAAAAAPRARVAVQVWASLPDLAANACQGAPPAALAPAAFYRRVGRAVVSRLLSLVRSAPAPAPAASPNAAWVWLREAAERVCRRGHVAALGWAWYDATARAPSGSGSRGAGAQPATEADTHADAGAAGAPTSVAALLALLPRDAWEDVLAGLLRAAAGAAPRSDDGPTTRRRLRRPRGQHAVLRRLVRCLGLPSALAAAGALDTLCRRVLAAQVWHGSVQRAACDYLGSELPPRAPAAAFLAAVPAEHVAALWATPDVVTSWAGARQQSLTALLLACLQRAPAEVLNPAGSRVVFSVMDGVQVRWLGCGLRAEG